MDTGINLNLIWILGHCGIQGNKGADVAAKEAATHKYSTETFNQRFKMEGDLVLLIFNLV